jgi:hypothetical protein
VVIEETERGNEELEIIFEDILALSLNDNEVKGEGVDGDVKELGNCFVSEEITFPMRE